MSMPAMFIDHDEIVLHFETQDTIDVVLLCGLILDLMEIARRNEFFGPDVTGRFVDLRTGSLTAKIKLFAAGMASRENFRDGLTVAGLAVSVYAAMQNPAEPAGTKCAQIMIDQSVQSVTVCSADQQLVIVREQSAAVRALEQQKRTAQTGNKVVPDSTLIFGNPLDDDTKAEVERKIQRLPEAPFPEVSGAWPSAGGYSPPIVDDWTYGGIPAAQQSIGNRTTISGKVYEAAKGGKGVHSDGTVHRLFPAERFSFYGANRPIKISVAEIKDDAGQTSWLKLLNILDG